MFRLQVPAVKASCLEYQTATTTIHRQAVITTMTTTMTMEDMMAIVLVALLHELAGISTVLHILVQ